jgi:hypothetical protein
MLAIRKPTMRKPTPRDVKRLFALSGNRCAFPRCAVLIAEGTSLIGEICRIHTDSPNGPRYNHDQTDEERQGFDNLILMCPNHHKVVDDDDISYPAERLRQIKHEHESRHIAALEDELSAVVVQLLIDQSTAISAQSSGFAAHTVHAQTINLNQTLPTKNLKIEEAVEVFWETVLKLKKEFSEVPFIDSILLASELDECFRGNKDIFIYGTLRRYKELPLVARSLQSIIPANVEDYRLYVSDRLWAIYSTLRTLHGRTAMLITASFKEKRLNDWRDDGSLNGTLRQTLDAGLIDAVKRMQIGGLNVLIGELENKFRREAATL